MSFISIAHFVQYHKIKTGQKTGFWEIILVLILFALLLVPTILAAVFYQKNKLSKQMRNVTAVLNVLAIVVLYTPISLLGIVLWIVSFFTMLPDKKSKKKKS